MRVGRVSRCPPTSKGQENKWWPRLASAPGAPQPPGKGGAAERAPDSFPGRPARVPRPGLAQACSDHEGQDGIRTARPRAMLQTVVLHTRAPFGVGCIKCKHLPNARTTEPIHCNLNLLNLISGGGVSLCGPYSGNGTHHHDKACPAASACDADTASPTSSLLAYYACCTQ